MIVLLTLVVMVYLTWKHPLSGYAFFFLANTGTAGFFRQYGLVGEIYKISNTDIILILAILVTLIRNRERNPGRWKYDTIGACFLGISIFVFERAAIIAAHHDPFTYPLADVMWWFPLYLAFVRMPYRDRRSLINIVIFTSIITAILSIIIVLTHNEYLLRTLGGATSPGGENFISARIIIDGVWTVMPAGYWFCLGEMLSDESKWSWIYPIGVIMMTVATVLTVTRSSMIILILGTVISFYLTYHKASAIIKKRMHISIALIIPCAILFILFKPSTLINAWLMRTTGEDERITGTLDLRVNRDVWMWNRLKKGDALLRGMKSDDSGWAETGGDAAAPFNIWWTYGLSAMILYYMMFLSVLANLYRKSKDKNPKNRKSFGVMYVQWMFIISSIDGMFSGFYFIPISIIVGTLGYAWCVSNNYVDESFSANPYSLKHFPMHTSK